MEAPEEALGAGASVPPQVEEIQRKFMSVDLWSSSSPMGHHGSVVCEGVTGRCRGRAALLCLRL